MTGPLIADVAPVPESTRRDSDVEESRPLSSFVTVFSERRPNGTASLRQSSVSVVPFILTMTTFTSNEPRMTTFSPVFPSVVQGPREVTSAP